jgi:tRNA (guanine37-N1)-methyltransferase
MDPIRKPAALSPEVRNFLREQSATLSTHNVHLTYDYWTAGTSCVILHVDSNQRCLDEILHSILPEELCKGSPSGFAITGHLGEHDGTCVRSSLTIPQLT